MRKLRTHGHDDEDDKVDVDVSGGMSPMTDDLFIGQVFCLSCRPGDVTEQLIDGLAMGQLKNLQLSS